MSCLIIKKNSAQTKCRKNDAEDRGLWDSIDEELFACISGGCM